jgi:hypothetical protein
VPTLVFLNKFLYKNKASSASSYSQQISTTSIIHTSAESTTPESTRCISHYWPVADYSVSDQVGGKDATSPAPQFVPDRFGVINGAVQISSKLSGWQLPPGSYIQNDFTLTMWVKKLACGGLTTNFGLYGKLYF